MLNGDAIHIGLVPCETNPVNGGLSRTLEEFHDSAFVTVGSQKGNKRHVCQSCADKHHKAQKQSHGIVWD